MYIISQLDKHFLQLPTYLKQSIMRAGLLNVLGRTSQCDQIIALAPFYFAARRWDT